MKYVYYHVLEEVQHRFTKGMVVRGDRVERAVRDAFLWDDVDLIPCFHLISGAQDFQAIIRAMPEDLYWCLNEDLLADYLSAVGLNYHHYRYDDDAIAAANAVHLPGCQEYRQAGTLKAASR